ncbi:Ctr copper transporter [Microthyrium microscopicum]|uniref:Copper transport protein n=1 Tax=Microthyrium microscopicum TaxID=703497 RepID=A0A6A6U454_9PEZI|nr:Ctr copper transporter [Microthyrium microscopicum]
MLWNWHTIDACFLARSWQITSQGAFAGTCIGVVLLVMTLEGLRRAAVEWERVLATRAQKAIAVTVDNKTRVPSSDSGTSGNKMLQSEDIASPELVVIRPTVWQALVRSGLHCSQFAVAYLVMLMAMYYNGYIIICIFSGAFLGFFVFSGFQPIQVKAQAASTSNATVCCG